MKLISIFVSLLCLASSSFADQNAIAKSKDGSRIEPQKDLHKKTSGIAPKSPQASLATIRVQSGLVVEIVAAEPLIADPVAFDWGTDGRLWVVEMGDYPDGIGSGKKPGGRVKILADSNGDGRYDKATLFLDGLNFPTAVKVWQQGVLILAAPDILYAEDSNGDGRADLKKVLFSGFGQGNQQHRANGLRWRLDGMLQVANGDSGGIIKSSWTGKTVPINGRDLSLNPDSGQMVPTSGQTQFGSNRDDWGNWFGCNNSYPLWHYPVSDHYFLRNPHILPPPTRVHVIGGGPVYPLSKTLKRPNYPGSKNRFTSACSSMFYRDSALGEEFTDNVFICEPVHNLVYRGVLTPKGMSYSARRAEDDTKKEFLASTDNWFRPVMVRTGPDGAIWIADMYRFIIEHPKWIPRDWHQRFNLQAGSDRGRIYRVFRKNSKKVVPRLDGLGIDGLVAALDSGNGTQRDRVQQELLERAAPESVPPLRKLATAAKHPAVRLQAMYTLQGLGEMTRYVLKNALNDPHPELRRHGLRLSETTLDSDVELGRAVANLATDPSVRVRTQVAFSLGEWHAPEAGRTLGAMLKQAGLDAYLRQAILSSAIPHLEVMLAELKPDGDTKPTSNYRELLKIAANKSAPKKALVQVTRHRQKKDLQAAKQRIKTVTAYRKAMLSLSGDATRGERVFANSGCIVCHEKQDTFRIGPDLAALSNRTADSLLTAILDPNLAVEKKFQQYTLVTTDGRTLSGRLENETTTSVTLLDLQGKANEILRQDLVSLTTSERSLMPEIYDKIIDIAAMTDLIAYLQVMGEKVTSATDGSLTLPATEAKIIGNEIRLDKKNGVIGWWTHRQDRAEWQIRPARAGKYRVELDWSCDDKTAGNNFRIQVGDSSLSGTVPGTGNWDHFQSKAFGTIRLKGTEQKLTFAAAGELKGLALIDLRTIRLIPLP